MKRTIRRGRLLLVAALFLSLGAGSGCQNMNNTERGALAGGGVGALAGGLIGSTKGKAGAGALIGGAAGTIIGGLAGNAEDKRERKIEQQVAAANANPPLSLEQIVQLTANGTSDDVIISQIHSTGSVYHLNADQIIWLQNNGVREPVVRTMQQTAMRPVKRVYTAVPVAQPVYVVPAPPPPPVGIGVGLHFRR